ncbi:hypothetical protein SAMN05216553_109153 [Lentzea fradiae]|uniref:Uncharacterized protein n=1 Tax=Lentzea fradiae TaxID=200378 RepID=A0A1G7VF09_9PSEU|nr:hypothetical protein [Lentzea fradiae]SDG57520.1 hypothetical protein SAMN05216553_109153 [Lentzea fradiae]
MRHSVIALALLLVGCGSTTTSLPTISPASPSSHGSALPELQPRLDAVGALLTACVARLRGEPVDPADNCARLLPDVTAVVDEVERQSAKLAPAGQAAIADVRRQVSELAPCEPWFAAGGASADASLDNRCGQAWDALFQSYHVIRNSA